MSDILKDVLRRIPSSVKISDAVFEGANIVLYTKDREFFLDNNGVIRAIVDEIKKRVEVRPDPSMTMDMEKAEEEIREIIPKEAGQINLLFDPQRSQVVIEAEKPGLAIGKNGEVLREIKKESLWVPLVKRIPAIRSKIIENIRQVLYENNDYRRKFLNKIGERVYQNWQNEERCEWIRVTFLGGAREVGRSCILLQTPKSKILLDCGVNVAGSDKDAYPYFDAPEFNINELDAVILSHPHLDHSGAVPLLFKYGYRGPVYCTEPTRDIAALLGLDFIGVAAKEARDAVFSSTDIKEFVKHTITLNYDEVYDITPDVRITLYNAGHALGSAEVHLHIGNGVHNLLYSGDIKYVKTRLLEHANTKFPRLETLIIEATYGGKDNVLPPRQEAESELITVVKNTIENGGKVLIPVMGVGRAQEVMLILHDAIKKGEMKEVPIFVQGMVWDITAIHTAYPDFLNNNVKKAIFHRDQNPFLNEMFRQVGSTKERKQVLEETGPCIILATSGMLSVDSEEPLFIKNDSQIRIKKIGKVVDEIIEGSNKKCKIKGLIEGDTAIPHNNLKVACYDPRTGEVKFKPVQLVIRHRVDRPIYEVTLNSLRRVKVTESHSVMVLENGEIKEKKVEDLTKDDYVVILKKALDNTKEDTISLFNEIKENIPEIYQKTIFIRGLKKIKYKNDWQKNHKTICIKDLENIDTVAKVGYGCATSHELSTKLKVTKELARLLGYYAAEGSVHLSDKSRGGFIRLSFGLNEKQNIINDAVECIKKTLNITPKVTIDEERVTKEIKFGGKLEALIFKYILKTGINSHTKRIPNIILNADKETRFEFLKAYYKGDGSNYQYGKKKDRYSLSANSVNQNLIVDLVYLFSLLEVPVTRLDHYIKQKRMIRNTELPESEQWGIRITNKNYMKKILPLIKKEFKNNIIKSRISEKKPFTIPVDKLNFKETLKKIKSTTKNIKLLKSSIASRKRITITRLNKFIKLINKEGDNNSKKEVKKLIPFTKDCIGFDQVREIKKVKASNGYVYDVSVPGNETFFGGRAGILLHNTGGASVEFFREMADNHKNTIVFVGYQSEGTLGKRIQAGEKGFVMSGENGNERVEVMMNVHTVDGLSGHCGRNELTRFVYNLEPRPKKIIVVHGESSRCLDLASSLHKMNNVETNAPKNLESIRIR